MSEDYEYFAKVWPGQTEDRPSTLWRKRDGEVEYLSVVDWSWHSGSRTVTLPHPDTLVPVSVEHAAALLADRQHFVHYWIGHDDDGRPSLAYRRRQSPERVADEVFGLDNEWIRTSTIKEFVNPGPRLRPDLTVADRADAERVIEETRGISGATEL